MGNWFCECVRVIKVEKHNNADNLDVVTVLHDYQVICKIGEYKVGDLAAFIIYDSIPGKHEVFNFLGKDRFKRVKPKKLRGVFSYGFLIKAPEGFKEGDSVADYFGVTRWEPDFEKQNKKIIQDGLKINGKNGLNEKGPMHCNLPYYDLDTINKFGNNLEDGEEVFITEKLNGEAFVVVFTEGKLFCRSRNYFKKKDEDSKWWSVPIRDSYEEKLSQHPNKAFFGELIGHYPSMRYDCNIIDGLVNRKFKVYDVYDIGTKLFMNYEDREILCNNIGLEMVPLLYNGPWKKDKSLYFLAENDSVLANHLSEGFVIEPKIQRNDNQGRKIKYKYISKRYHEMMGKIY
ncbi:MAG: hypothetical protein LC122_14400 [Chitinophagales bacterium]|nr:hypothetical protein [Chitinophagales bacterium]